MKVYLDFVFTLQIPYRGENLQEHCYCHYKQINLISRTVTKFGIFMDLTQEESVSEKVIHGQEST